MSGVENINGISYQISFSLLKTLELLAKEDSNVDKLKFESINEEEEDFTVYNLDHTIDYYQIKKKSEEYQWTKSTIKSVLHGFADKYKDEANFFFVTNGSGNQDVKKIKKICEKNEDDITNEDKIFLDYFVNEKYTLEKIVKTLVKTKLLTRYYVSMNDEEDGMIKNEILKKLNSSNFYCQISIEQLYNSLWIYIFGKSKFSQYVDFSEIISDFFDLGLELIKEDWIEGEVIAGRLNEINEILSTVEPIIVLKGISGIGKSSIAKKINYNSVNKSILIEISSFMTPAEFIGIFIKKLKYLNLENSIERMNNSELSNYISDLIQVIKYECLMLIIDGYDKANHQLEDFINQIGESVLVESNMFESKILLLSVERPKFYNDVHIKLYKVHECLINGFSYKDTFELFSNLDLNQRTIEKLHEKVAGYPLGLLYMKQLIQIGSYDIEEIEQISFENATEVLFKKVYDCLTGEQRKVAEIATIFPTVFSMKDIEIAADEEFNSQFVLRDLFNLSILDKRDEGYIVHDVVRKLIGKILPEKKIAKLHLNYANFLYSEVEREERFSDIFSWGYHYENSQQMTNECFWLSKLEIEKINALGAIISYGYPFNFLELSLNDLDQNINCFEERGWIKQGINKLGLKEYEVDNMEDKIIDYAIYLSRIKGNINHMGYFEVFSKNDSFMNQMLICEWEHCIEHMPLRPDYTDIEIKNIISTIQNKDKKKVFEKIFSEQIDLNQCPIFGHCCPGGVNKVKECTSLFS